MGLKTERLIAALGEVAFLLQENGDKYHANKVAKAKLMLEQSDFRGISHVLSVFNGKSSIYDVDWPSTSMETDQISVDDRFQGLSSTIYDLAEEIRREVERGER